VCLACSQGGRGVRAPGWLAAPAPLTWRAHARARNTDEWHRLQWDQAADEIGRQMLALFRNANALRRRFPALRRGGVAVLHEVRSLMRARAAGARRARACGVPGRCVRRSACLALCDTCVQPAAWLGSQCARGTAGRQLANIMWWLQDRPNGVMAFERTDGTERIVTVVNAGRSSFQARQKLKLSVNSFHVFEEKHTCQSAAENISVLLSCCRRRCLLLGTLLLETSPTRQHRRRAASTAAGWAAAPSPRSSARRRARPPARPMHLTRQCISR